MIFVGKMFHYCNSITIDLVILNQENIPAIVLNFKKESEMRLLSQDSYDYYRSANNYLHN